jgi:urease alpha subunit
VSQLCKSKGVAKSYGLNKRIEAVKGCRKIGKKDLKWNNAMPKITVDPETYEVRADGELLTCEPAKFLPLAQRYFLF